MHKTTLASLLAALILAGGTLAQNPAAQPAAPGGSEKILALVGTEKVTEAELDTVMRGQLQGRDVPPETVKELRGMILKGLIERHLVNQFLSARKVAADPARVEEQLNQIKANLAQQGVDLAEALGSQGLTEQAFRERLGERIAFEGFAESQATDQKLQDFFASHKREFDGSQVKASHILIQVDGQSAPEARKAAAEKIAAIRQEVSAGLDFAEAAKKYSSCPSSAQGGDLGFFGRHNQMVEPFAAAAFSLPVGEVSQPVETEFGYHLIKVTETKPGERTFEESKDSVKSMLYQQIWESAAEQQRKVTKVEISEG